MTPELRLHVVSHVTWVLQHRICIPDAEAKTANNCPSGARTHLEYISGNMTLDRVCGNLSHQDKLEISVNELARIEKREILCHFPDSQE